MGVGSPFRHPDISIEEDFARMLDERQRVGYALLCEGKEGSKMQRSLLGFERARHPHLCRIFRPGPWKGGKKKKKSSMRRTGPILTFEARVDGICAQVRDAARISRVQHLPPEMNGME